MSLSVAAALTLFSSFALAGPEDCGSSPIQQDSFFGIQQFGQKSETVKLFDQGTGLVCK
jgi:hypothetical protein